MLRARKNMYWKGDNDRYDLCFVIEDSDAKRVLEQDDCHINGKDELIVLSMVKNIMKDQTYTFVSDLLHVEQDEVEAETLDNAMEELEYKVEEYLQVKTYVYDEMLSCIEAF